MKKLLLIALLIVGCDYAPTNHTHDITGICTRENSNNGGFACLPSVKQAECLEAEAEDDSNYKYFENLTCEEFCNQINELTIDTNGQSINTTCDIGG